MSKQKQKPEPEKSPEEKRKEEEKELARKKRSRIYWSIFLIVVVILFIVNNTRDEPEKGPYPPNYLEYNSQKLKLSDYSGKIVILDFWATWCAPCREGIPDLIELKSEFGEKIEIIGISVDGITRGGQTKKEVVPFMNMFNINYPVVYGTQKVNYQYGGINSIPTTFVLDTNGMIVSKYDGLVSKDVYLKDIKSIIDGTYEKSNLIKAQNFELPMAKNM